MYCAADYHSYMQWRHQKFFCGGGASRGQNTFLRGNNKKKLPKMADFGHFFFWLGASGGAEPPTGGQMPPCPPLMPPLAICVTHVQKNFSIRTSIKQLLTKYQIFTKLPQIPHIHINLNFSSIFATFWTNCFIPIHFMAGTCQEYSFSIWPVVSC